MNHLCEIYWYPLYAYVRRRGSSPQDAQDLTQAFFLRLFEKNALALADKDRGRFRSFLLSALKRFMINEWAKTQTVRRGGGRMHFSLDAERAEQRYSAEPRDDMTPEMLFEKRWATTLLEEALESLRREYVEAGNLEFFEKLKTHLWGDRAVPYAEVAQQFGMKEPAARAAASRLRKRFAQTVRKLIADTVATPDQIEEELNSLIASFSA